MRAVLRVNALHRRLDVVILTSEPVLAALLDGRLPMVIALERNIVVVDGEAAGAATVRPVCSPAR